MDEKSIKEEVRETYAREALKVRESKGLGLLRIIGALLRSDHLESLRGRRDRRFPPEALQRRWDAAIRLRLRS